MMKKINLIYMLLAVVLLSGCDKYLDIQPVGQVIPRTVKEYRALMTKAYMVVPADRGLATFRSDEMLMDASLSTEDLNSYKEIWSWNDSSPSEDTSAFNWRQFYEALFIANYVIESQDRIEEGSAEAIEQLVGEAYMLRAYMHFLLVNLYADPYTHCDPVTTKGIPLRLNSDTEQVLSRNTIEEVYQSILTDLTDAKPLLHTQQWEAGYTYRFTPLSVEALRSRVFLYMGRWEESLIASQAVLHERGELADLSSILPNYYNSVEVILALEQVMTAQYVRAAKVSTSLWQLYGTGDLRKTKYFKQVTASNIQVQKGGSNEYRCSFRVGEIYLNAAETALKLGGENALSAARTYLLELMKHRYSANAYTNKEVAVNSYDSEALLKEIYNERTRELAFEGHRWFDLRRTTRPRLEKNFGTTLYVLEQNDSRYTIRIPSGVIAANPELAN